MEWIGSPLVNFKEHDMSLRAERAAVFAAAQNEMMKAVRTQPEASAADIRPHIHIPEGVNPSIIGTAIRELKREGLIVAVGTVATSLPAGHCHLMRVWKLAEPAGEVSR